MYRLECNVQKYGWGRIGQESKVAKYKSAQDSQFVIADTLAYAEMWMGMFEENIHILLQNVTSKLN